MLGSGIDAVDGVRALDRYELLYRAHLVPEWFIDHGQPVGAVVPGRSMARDHRRVVATALSRLRGKLTYRPVVFDLLEDAFTLTHLQRTVEAIAGQDLHTQNFRRLVDRTGLVAGSMTTEASGGINEDTIRAVAEIGVDVVSIGALTHSAPTADVALDLVDPTAD